MNLNTCVAPSVLVQALPFSLPVGDCNPLLDRGLHLGAQELLLTDAVVVAGVDAVKGLANN